MLSKKHLSIVASLAAELLLWLAPAAAFIGIYVLQFNGPDTAVAAHLKLIGSLGIAWLGLRLLFERASPGRVARTTFQVSYSLVLVVLFLYYAIVLVGLSSWGRVPTLRLLAVYFDQWRDLLGVLGAPVMLVPVVLGAICILAFLLVRFAHARLHWPQYIAQSARIRMIVVFAIASLLPFAVFATEAYLGVDRLSGEPVSMTINASNGATVAQTNTSGGAKLLDKREAAAAAAYRTGELASPRNVILIVGDALRADHLGVLGYSRPTTPQLDRLAAEGRFALAQPIHSTCAESYCGLMSIARSKYVHEFSTESLSLQKVLARHGYRVALILGGDHTNFYGLADALGPADLYWDGSMGAAYVNDDRAVVERVASLPDWDGKPMFLQLHLMSSHGLGRRHEEFVRFEPATNYYRPWAGESVEDRRVEATNFYDNGILQFDSIVNDNLQVLREKGYLDDALVIVTGDHGDMLGEQGRYSHSEMVYGPVLNIPLLVLRFGYEGPAIAARDFASQVDIAPTVLLELGLPVPESWSGTAMQLPAVRDYLYYQQGTNIGLFDLRDSGVPWKFWIDTRSGEYFAFDAARDVGEADNRIDEISPELRSEWVLQLLPASATINEWVVENANTQPR